MKIYEDCHRKFLDLMYSSKTLDEVDEQRYVASVLRHYGIPNYILEGTKSSAGCRFMLNVLTQVDTAIAIVEYPGIRKYMPEYHAEYLKRKAPVVLSTQNSGGYRIDIGNFETVLTKWQLSKIYKYNKKSLTNTFFIIDRSK